MSKYREMSPHEAIARASEHERELLELLGTLVRVPSPFGTAGEDAQALVAEYLHGHGFESLSVAIDPASHVGHPEFMPPGVEAPALNLICRPRGGAVARQLLFAHIDTADVAGAVPKPALRGNRMYGPGVADDKAGVAACAVAAAILRDGGYPAPTVLTVHGKGGGARGTLRMVQEARDVYAALYVHPAETGRGLHDIKRQSRGVLDLGVRVSGWIGDEEEPGNPESVPPRRRGNALAACIAVVERWREAAPAGCAINLGALQGGEHPGTTPLDAVARVRIVFEGPRTVEEVLARLYREAAVALERFAAGAAGQACRVTLTPDGLCANPASTPVESRWYQAVHSAVAAVTGRAPEPYDGHLCSDIRFPVRLLGVPCVGIGPEAGNFHSGEEWVDVPDLIRTVAAIVLAVPTFEKEQRCPSSS